MITSSPTRPDVAPQSCTARRIGYWVAKRAFLADSCDSDCWGAARGKARCLQTSRTFHSHLAAPCWTSWSLLWRACGHCGPGLDCTVLQSNRQRWIETVICTYFGTYSDKYELIRIVLKITLDGSDAVKSRNCNFEAEIVIYIYIYIYRSLKKE